MSDYADVVAETTATDGTPFRVVLHYDQDASSMNPRDNDFSAGVMHVVTQHRYDVPQETDGIATTSAMDDAIIDHAFPVVARWLRIFHGATVVLPLYRAGGNDFTIGAGEPTDTPDAGDYLGVTFDTADTRRESFGNEYSADVMGAALAADVATYGQWAEGDVYGLAVQNAELDDDGDIVDWVTLGYDQASLWGLIGRDWAEENAREALDAIVADHDETVAQRRADAADDAAEIDELRAIETGTYAV